MFKHERVDVVRTICGSLEVVSSIRDNKELAFMIGLIYFTVIRVRIEQPLI